MILLHSTLKWNGKIGYQSCQNTSITSRRSGSLEQLLYIVKSVNVKNKKAKKCCLMRVFILTNCVKVGVGMNGKDLFSTSPCQEQSLDILEASQRKQNGWSVEDGEVDVPRREKRQVPGDLSRPGITTKSLFPVNISSAPILRITAPIRTPFI